MQIGNLNKFRKRAGAQKQKKPRNLMNWMVGSLSTMMVVSLLLFYVGARQGWIHTRWNYDDSEYHYVMHEAWLLDLELQAIDCELYEATKRVGILMDYVNKMSLMRGETPTRYE